MAVSRRLKVGLAALALGSVVVLGSARSGANVGGNDRVSVTSAGGQLSGSSSELLDMTPSAQWVLFRSNATELGITSGSGLFLRDRLADTTTRIDTVNGVTPTKAAISDDGRYTIYVANSIIQLYDRTAGTTTSLGTASAGEWIAMSGDGSTVAYTLSSGQAYTRATATGTLSALGLNDIHAISSTGRYLVWKPSSSVGIWRFDRQTAGSDLVSKSGSTPVAASRADISADGAKVVFQSAANSIAGGDTDGKDDVFVWSGGTNTLATTEAGVNSSDPSISADGTMISYFSQIDGQTAGVHLLRQVGYQTEALARRPDGTGGQTHTSSTSRLSSNGRWSAYSSTDSGLVAGDTNGVMDVFVRDRIGDTSGTGAGTITGTIVDENGAAIDGAIITVTGPRGTFTAFSGSDGSYSFAPLPSGRWTMTATAAGRAGRYFPGTNDAAVSHPVFVDDGETVALDPMPLLPLDSRPASTVTRAGYNANGASSGGSMSADGRYVGFTSAASNLVAGDTNGVSDVFVADRQTGTIIRVSVDANGNQLPTESIGGDVSDDGRTVAFVTASDGVVAGDADGLIDVFVRNLNTDTSTKVTATVSGTLRRPTLVSYGLDTRLSGDGGFVAYRSGSISVVFTRPDGAITPSVGAYNLARSLGFDGSTIMTERLSTIPGDFGSEVVLGTENLGIASPAGLSRNERWLAFSTDGNRIKVRDRQTNTTTTYSTRWGSDSAPSVRGGGGSMFGYYSFVKLSTMDISDDGRFVVFTGKMGYAEPLSDRNGVNDVFVLDRTTGDIRRVSVGNDRSELPGGAVAADISGDGTKVLVRGKVTRDDTNGVDDLVVIDLLDDFTGVVDTGELHGTVTSGGNPVGGAMVRVLIGTERVARTTTAPDGTWRIAGLRPAGYRVKVDDPTNTHVGRFAPSAARAAEAVTTTVTSGSSHTVDTVLPAAPPAPGLTGSASRVSPLSMATIRPAVSANGRFVAYVTTSQGVIVRDRIMETERRLDGPGAAGSVSEVAISDDGLHVAFVSTSPDLVSGDSNAKADVFFGDSAGTSLQRISLTPGGGQFTNASGSIDISGDGKHVSFVQNGSLFRWDESTGTTSLVDTLVSTSPTALNTDGTAIAYLRSNNVVVSTNLVPTVVSTLSGRVHALSSDGTQVLWSGYGPGSPGAPDQETMFYQETSLGASVAGGTWGLFLTDVASGATQQVDVATGGLESGLGMGGYYSSTMTADMSGDGRLVVIENAGRQFANESDDDVEVWVRDLDAGTTIPLGSVATQFALSSDGNTLVSLRNQILWAAPVPADRKPPSPVLTLFGPQGDGVTAVWQASTEQPSQAPTEVIVERYEDGGSTPVETVSLPYSPDYGIYQAPSVPPGSTQRVEVRFRNAKGDSAPAKSKTLSMDDNVTIDVSLQGPVDPVPYAAVVVYDLDGHPVTFGTTGLPGTASLTVVPGSYRLRAYASNLTPYVDAWYGGGPTAATGVLVVPSGSHPSVTIDVPLPGTVTPVSQSKVDGNLNAGTSTYADLSPDGRYVGFTTGTPFVAPTSTQSNRAGFIRDLQTGQLWAPCEAQGGVSGGSNQLAVSSNAAFVARLSYDGKRVTRCERATGEVKSLTVTTAAAGATVIGTLQISDDGSVIAFSANATVGLVGTDSSKPDAFVWRPATNAVQRLTNDTGSTNRVTGITGDGATVSVLTNQVLNPADTFGDTSLYLVDTTSGAATIASVHPIGTSAHATAGTVSRDGTSAVFVSSVATLPGSKAGVARAYRFRPSTGTVVAASTNGTGGLHTGSVSDVSISGDGNRVGYLITSPETLDVNGDEAAVTGAYVLDVSTGALRQVDVAANQPRASTTGASALDLDATGDAAVFLSADVLLPHETDTTSIDTFYWTRASRPAYVPVPGDVAPPQLRMPTTQVAVAAPGDTGASVALDVTAEDAFDGTVPVNCTGTLDPYPLGDTTVTCSATDNAGYSASQSMTVRVIPQGATGYGANSSRCAVLQDATVSCSGLNAEGQLGRGTYDGTYGPGAVPGLGGVTAIASGTYRWCALDTTGNVRCWGRGQLGENGDGTTGGFAVSPVTVQNIGDHATAITAASASTCARMDDATVKCWGNNSSGQLGSGNYVNQSTAQPVTGLTDVAKVAMGWSHACALKSDATVACWGSNAWGQLGNGTTANSLAPTPVPGLTDVVDLTAGTFFTCAVRSDGTATCWGRNYYGSLGNPVATQSLVPVPVVGLGGAVEIRAFDHTVCSRLAGGNVWCWGNNASWRLGRDSSAASSDVAAPVAKATDAVSLGVGTTPCYVTTAAAVRCTENSGTSTRLTYATWLAFL